MNILSSFSVTAVAYEPLEAGVYVMLFEYILQFLQIMLK
jgi:hypothetical protein